MEEQAVTACWRRLEIGSNGSTHESGVNKTPILGRCQVITRSVHINLLTLLGALLKSIKRQPACYRLSFNQYWYRSSVKLLLEP